MKKNIKYIIIGLIAISSFSILLIFNFVILPNLQSNINQNNNNNRVKQFEVKNISVFIDYSGVQDKDNEFFQNLNLTNYETTAFHALLNCCEVKTIDYGWGLYVEEINGIGRWIYWINNDPSPSMASNYFYLLDNDTVNWKHV